jgi:biopolymer transport protein ExbD
MIVKNPDDFYGNKTMPHLIAKLLMVQINAATTDRFRKRAGIRKPKRNSLMIDMTPMVDLGFLLISFFVITAELSRPSAINLVMPKDVMPPSELGDSYALTLILNGGKNFQYTGSWNKAMNEKMILPVTNMEIRSIIQQQQHRLDNREIYKEGRDGLMILIKPSSKANYKEVVDMFDEAIIGRVKKYAIIKLSDEESLWLRNRK